MEFWLLRNNEKYGPYSQEKIIEFAKQGNLSVSDRLWHHGLEGWKAPLSVLPSLELSDSGQRVTEGPSLGSRQDQEQPGARREPRRRRSSFIRSGLIWIPLFSALLVGALGFQPFVRSAVGPGLSEALRDTGWFEPEEAEILAIGGASMLIVELYQESADFRVLSWSVGLLVGAVNGLSFGAILGWLAARVGSRGSLQARIVILSVLGGAIAWVLGDTIKYIFGDETLLVLFMGFLSWREGLLLGAFFAVVHTLDELRARAVNSRTIEGGV